MIQLSDMDCLRAARAISRMKSSSELSALAEVKMQRARGALIYNPFDHSIVFATVSSGWWFAYADYLQSSITPTSLTAFLKELKHG